MSILDTIANEPVKAQTITQPRTSESNKALADFGRSLPAFRGLLKDVRGIDNGELLNVAKIGWKVHSYDVGLIGKKDPKDVRKSPRYQGLVRGDNGRELAIVSSKFQVHQNSDIMAGLKELADRGEAEICYAGSMDYGRRIAAIARMQGEFTLPDKRGGWNNHAGEARDGDDKTQLFIVLSGGHDVGTPLKVRGLAFRKWCANGAYFEVSAAATFRLTHLHKLGTAELDRLALTYEEIRRQFETYADTARRLQQIEMDKEQSRLYVAELLLPGIYSQIQKRLSGMPGARPDLVWEEMATLRGKQALEATIIENEKAAGFNRLGKYLVDAIANQQGSNGPNLWSGYNGITWYVDHIRGRNPETGLEAAMFGEGATLKENALTTAMKFVG